MSGDNLISARGYKTMQVHSPLVQYSQLVSNDAYDKDTNSEVTLNEIFCNYQVAYIDTPPAIVIILRHIYH